MYLWMRGDVCTLVLIIITLCHMWWSFGVKFDKVGGDRFFFDIGEFVDHHCSNPLFMTIYEL
jgi:hypothetical protein